MATRPLARGDVVLVPFPFTDLSSSKLRPAVVIATHTGRDDVTLAFVSSRDVGRGVVDEVAVLPMHPEFALSGLAAPSTVRAGKLVTLARSLVRRWLGRLGTLLLIDLDRALVAALGINTIPYREEGRRDERARLGALHGVGGPPAVLADLGFAVRSP
jgi:mRNA interferase MazF